MIKQIKLKSSNCYLIKNEELNKCILVDTGSDEDSNELLKELGNENISVIIITHGHYDSMSNLKMLCAKYNSDVFMNKDDYDLFDNQLSHDIYTEGFFNKMKLDKFKKEVQDKSIERPNRLYDAVNGDVFTKYGFNDVKIIGLSGHTRGSIGVLVGKKDLIVGDTLTNEKNISLPIFYEEKASLDNSIEQIKDILPSKLYPSKGDAFNYDDYFQMEKIKIKKQNIKSKKK